MTAYDREPIVQRRQRQSSIAFPPDAPPQEITESEQKLLDASLRRVREMSPLRFRLRLLLTQIAHLAGRAALNL